MGMRLRILGRIVRLSAALLLIGFFSGIVSAESRFVAGELLITLRSDAHVETLARQYGFVPVDRLESATTWRVALPPHLDERLEALELSRDLRVDSVELNSIHYVPEALHQNYAVVSQESLAFVDSQTPAQFFRQGAVLRIKSSEAHVYSTGRGVVIALIDTGVDPDHPTLQSKLISGWDFINHNAQPLDAPSGIGYGHGTFVAGLLTLVAPDARIMPLRALHPDGRGSTFAVAQAIRFAADHGAHIINLSLGMTHPSPVVKDAIHYASRRGLVIVAAAGNGDTLCPQFPAGYRGVLAVAAVDNLDRKAPFSNFGHYIGASAPGVEIFSAFPNRNFAVWSGTSFSAALAAGAAALVRSLAPSLPPHAVIDVLKHSADPIDSLNPLYRGKLGEGRLNCLHATYPQ